MRERKQNMGVSLKASQREKLRTLAMQLGSSPNAVMGTLIDNARIGEVVRREAIAFLPTNANDYDVGQDIPVVAAA